MSSLYAEHFKDMFFCHNRQDITKTSVLLANIPNPPKTTTIPINILIYLQNITMVNKLHYEGKFTCRLEWCLPFI